MLRVAGDHFSHSDTGRARRANEDAYLARAPTFVVADGMGGAQAGEVASRIAVEAFERGLDDAEGSDEQRLAGRAREANARIYEMSQAASERAGMGTTLTAAHVGEHDVAIAHVGDSRAYRLRGGELERLTEDHSLVEELRRRGQLTAEEADEHPQRSIITRALGPEPDVDVDTFSVRAAAGDVYLLCSDGLTSMVSEARVAEILRAAGSLREAGGALIDEANAAGGRDNVTVVLFRVEEVDGGGGDGAEQPTSAGGPGAPLAAAEVRARLAEQERSAAGTPPDPAGTARGPAGTTRGAAETARAAGPAPAPPRLRPQPPSTPPSRRRRPRAAKTFAIVALVALPLALGAYAANRAVYFIGADDDGFVALYRGLPYVLPAGLELYSLTYVSGVPLRALPARRRARLLDHTLRSHDDASDLIRELERGRISAP